MKRVVNAVILVVFLATTFFVAGVIETGDPFGFQYRSQEVTWSAFLIIAVPTIVGALLGTIYGQLEQADDRSPWWMQVRSGFQSRRFGMSLFATPFIVFFVFDQLRSDAIDFGLALFCLQSGFFWERSFKTLIASRAPRVPSSPEESQRSP
jgi:hypothetical protein